MASRETSDSQLIARKCVQFMGRKRWNVAGAGIDADVWVYVGSEEDFGFDVGHGAGTDCFLCLEGGPSTSTSLLLGS